MIEKRTAGPFFFQEVIDPFLRISERKIMKKIEDIVEWREDE